MIKNIHNQKTYSYGEVCEKYLGVLYRIYFLVHSVSCCKCTLQQDYISIYIYIIIGGFFYAMNTQSMNSWKELQVFDVLERRIYQLIVYLCK